jgi:hypothetical protein
LFPLYLAHVSALEALPSSTELLLVIYFRRTCMTDSVFPVWVSESHFNDHWAILINCTGWTDVMRPLFTSVSTLLQFREPVPRIVLLCHVTTVLECCYEVLSATTEEL